LKGSVWDGIVETFRHPRALWGSVTVGAVIGIIPGVGATAANFLSYSIAKRTSLTPERFGKGSPEGVIAPEASNNSCIPTSFIPTLTLGIPGGATAAILLVAVTIHGIRPGPMLFQSSPDLVYGFFAGLMIATFAAAALCIAMIPWFALITVVRVELMAPVLIAVSLAGAYATQRSVADVFVAIAFGLFGYVARRNGFPLVPLIIGLILGSLVERSFHQALQISGGSYLTFVTHPMSAVILGCCVAMLVLPGFKRRFGG
jgi:putative tricarboxylic transport membrane protein